MKVKKKPNGDVKITVNQRHLQILAALLDYPYWDEQPPEIESFCSSLHEKFFYVLDEPYIGPTDLGFTSSTTIG